MGVAPTQGHQLAPPHWHYGSQANACWPAWKCGWRAIFVPPKLSSCRAILGRHVGKTGQREGGLADPGMWPHLRPCPLAAQPPWSCACALTATFSVVLVHAALARSTVQNGTYFSLLAFPSEKAGGLSEWCQISPTWERK